jgi:hypothetical protein
MELARQGSYRQLAEEIGEVLQAAAETAEKMQDEARADAARIRAEAEGERRIACAESRQILDEARMEADMLRAEAEWQAQEILAQARRQATERITGADNRLAAIEEAEGRVMDRLAGVGQMVADALATLREGRRESAAAYATAEAGIEIPPVPDMTDSDDASAEPPVDERTAKVYFVEFPPAAPAAPPGEPADASPDVDVDPELDSPGPVPDSPGPSLFGSDAERSEWAPPPEMPTWWTRGGVQG